MIKNCKTRREVNKLIKGLNSQQLTDLYQVAKALYTIQKWQTCKIPCAIVSQWNASSRLQTSASWYYTQGMVATLMAVKPRIAHKLSNLHHAAGLLAQAIDGGISRVY